MRSALTAILLATAIAVNMAMAPWYDSLFANNDPAPTAVSVLLEALGELRTFLAQQIWFDIDLYHHEMESQGVPWTAERDIMSMYRMVTLLDPRFVEAYDVGSYQLVENFHKPEEGLAFLEEGLAHNPDSAKLHFNKAFLLFRLNRRVGAVKSAARAMQLEAPDPAQLLKESIADQIPFLNALRIMAHAERGLGNRDAEVHALRIWLLLRPGDYYPSNRLRELNLPAEGYTPQEFLRAMGH